MATVVRHQKFASVDVVKNSNKVWEGKVYDDGTFEATWGRIGGTMQSESKQMGSVASANAYMDKKVAEKKKPKTDKATGMTTMYEEVPTVDTEGFQPPAKAAKSDLSRVAKKQIVFSNPIVADLIDRLAKANIHDILTATGGKMTYNDTTGLFSTPLGVVTQETIDEARGLLVDLATFVDAGTFEDETFIEKLQRYMRRIPQDLGYGRIDTRTVLPDLTAVQKQNSVLDSLEASLKMALSPPTSGKPVVVDEPKVFDVQLDLIEDGVVMDRLRRLYKDTRLDMHVCAHLDVRRVFAVNIKTMREAFEPVAKRIGNVKELWHGTRTANLLSILKGGLVIPPANAAHCTGRLYGNGVYGAIHSTKSLNYAYGYWGGGRDDNCFMFLMDMALGKVFHPTAREAGPYPKAGYDSTWAKGGVSPGVKNDELIVYRTDQVNLNLLLEFTPGGK